MAGGEMNGKRECMPTKPDLKGAVRREQEELLALHHVLGDPLVPHCL